MLLYAKPLIYPIVGKTTDAGGSADGSIVRAYFWAFLCCFRWATGSFLPSARTVWTPSSGRRPSLATGASATRWAWSRTYCWPSPTSSCTHCSSSCRRPPSTSPSTRPTRRSSPSWCPTMWVVSFNSRDFGFAWPVLSVNLSPLPSSCKERERSMMNSLLGRHGFKYQKQSKPKTTKYFFGTFFGIYERSENGCCDSISAGLARKPQLRSDRRHLAKLEVSSVDAAVEDGSEIGYLIAVLLTGFLEMPSISFQQSCLKRKSKKFLDSIF